MMIVCGFFSVFTFCVFIRSILGRATLRETVEDAHAANKTWLKWVNENVANGKITSSAGTAVVGDNEAFLWIDTYPDLATWSATKTALDTKEGKEALKDLFKDITDCKENRLWKLVPTE